jgi:3-oxoacyl-[acyl-carrier protein] reductase
MNAPLENRIALVTGASGAIGSAVATRLAADGAALLAHYGSDRDGAENVVAAIKQAGGQAEAVGADFSRPEGPTTLIAQLDRVFGGRFIGRLDVLVNNAGTLAMGPLAESTDEDFDRLFNVNVRAVFQLLREATRRMTKAGWGRIVNLARSSERQLISPAWAFTAEPSSPCRG